MNNIARKNGVILMGGSFDKEIPVTELAQSFEFNFDLYNRSEDKLSIAAAKDFYKNEIAALEPEAVIIHLGDEDMNMFKANPSDFDKNYIGLISEITSKNKKMRLALVSVNNPVQNEVISKMSYACLEIEKNSVEESKSLVG